MPLVPRTEINEPGLMHVRRGTVRTAQPSTGWRLFVIVVLLLGATANIVAWLAGINHDIYVAAAGMFAAGQSVWAWVWFFAAVLELSLAIGLWFGSYFAAALALVVVGVDLILHIVALGAHPTWPAVVIVVDLLALYGLARHGFE